MRRRRAELAGLWLVAITVVAVGWVELAAAFDLADVNSGQIMFVTLAALGAPALATAMLVRRPSESTGVLLGTAVLTSMLGACRTTPLGPFTVVAGFAALISPLLPAVVVLRYSGVDSPSHVRRGITLAATLVALLGVATGVLVLVTESVPGPVWFTDHPGEAVLPAQLLLGAQTVLVTGSLIAAAVSFHRRHLPPSTRAALRPIMLPAAAWALSAGTTAIWTLTASLTAPTVNEIDGNASAAFIILPLLLVVALAAGVGWVDDRAESVLRTSFGIGQHGRTRGARTVEQYLARALADPSIRVLYPIDRDVADCAALLPDSPVEDWVDADGSPAQPALDMPDRAVTLIRRGSSVIGLIEHDVAATARRDAIELVATGAGLVMETERLTAAAARDLERARLLAQRLLSASDEPRDVLRRELVEGPLADLGSIAAALEFGAPLAEAARRLTEVSAKVRKISHGVFPSTLRSGGLGTVLNPALVPARRYSDVVEMTAYLVARDDPTATVVEVTHEGGPALRVTTTTQPAPTVRDRVTALGGLTWNEGHLFHVIVPTGER